MLTFPVPFIEAAHFTPANRGRAWAQAPGLPDPPTVDLIPLHSMEHPEKPGTAREVALWLADPIRSPKASAHYCVDDREVIQSVREQDVAWAAPGANLNGIHIEHAGYAAQSASDWRDEYSMAMLHLSVELCAAICKTWGIPAVFVPAGAIAAGVRGITTHAQVSLAFNTRGGHTDPGPNFPISWYVSRVASLLTI